MVVVASQLLMILLPRDHGMPMWVPVAATALFVLSGLGGIIWDVAEMRSRKSGGS